jgi:hypothetical protein
MGDGGKTSKVINYAGPLPKGKRSLKILRVFKKKSLKT